MYGTSRHDLSGVAGVKRLKPSGSGESGQPENRRKLKNTCFDVGDKMSTLRHDLSGVAGVKPLKPRGSGDSGQSENRRKL